MKSLTHQWPYKVSSKGPCLWVKGNVFKFWCLCFLSFISLISLKKWQHDGVWKCSLPISQHL